ncbi:MAG: beta-ketoacyl synthase N-terminal-like domain-containing protein [Candidatus Omnitrophica bacterium]|nr:beta-ketoacyl synthase N-terminal-like domain-containing protein [Candidatus Omnitrophota bacterium]
MPIIVRGISIAADKESSNIDNILETVSSALTDGGVRYTSMRGNTSVILGTTFSNFHIRKENTDKYFKQGTRVINPADFPHGLISYLGGCVSVKFNIQGAQNTLSSGISSGVDALTYAFYLAAREKRSRTIVIELGESIERGIRFSLRGIVCCVIENVARAHKENGYGVIVGVESFFEKKGRSQGLEFILKNIFKRYVRGFDDPPCIVFSSASGTQRHNLERKAVRNAFGAAHAKMLPVIAKERNNNPGLFPMCTVLRNNGCYRHAHKKSIPHKSSLVLFINVGEDSNSSCVAVEMSLKEGAMR